VNADFEISPLESDPVAQQYEITYFRSSLLIRPSLYPDQENSVITIIEIG